MKNKIGLPLFTNIAQVPQCTELHGQYFERLDVQEGRTFWHLPKMKVIKINSKLK
jgi:hypothetical protein